VVPKILVIGGLGNMGSRYCAILAAMEVEYEILDIACGKPVDSTGFTGIIVATPTDTHMNVINQYKTWKLPILCEKPITKSPAELEKILAWDVNLRMINQYEYYFHKDQGVEILSSVPDHYNYFKTGGDGMLWDCINVVGGNGTRGIIINNTSPVWACQIKGKPLKIEEMDWAYIWNVRDWLDKRNDNKDYIKWVHNRIHRLIKKAKK